MPKALFALLVSIASIVGWQVIQKYKLEGVEKLATKYGWTLPGQQGSTAPAPNYPATNPNASYPNNNYPSTNYPNGQNPGYQLPQQNPQYGNNGYAPQPQYNYGTPSTYPNPQIPNQQNTQQYQYPPLVQNSPQPGYNPANPNVAMRPIVTPGYENQTGYNQPINNPYGNQPNTIPQYGGNQPGVNPAMPGNNQQRPATETLRIGSFNIQVFGEAKLRHSDPFVMGTIVDIIQRFDVVATQELRSTNDDIIPQLLQMVNARGKRYDAVVGPRLGRTSSKEQYVFIYNIDTIEVDRAACYTVKDPYNRLHRTPLVGCFRSKLAPTQQAFTFSLVNIHTDPDLVAAEVDALAEVIKVVQSDGRGEDDIILLGDLNADESHLGALTRIPNYVPIVRGVPTNTRGTKTYDNMLIFRNATTEFSNRWGVIDFASEYKLTEQQALKVSDHRPIWAEFSIYEGGTANRMVNQYQYGAPTFTK